MWNMLAAFARQDGGQDLIEYGLLASLIATLLVGLLTAMGEQVTAFWTVIVAGIEL